MVDQRLRKKKIKIHFFCRPQPSIDFVVLLSARKAIENLRAQLFSDLENRDNTNPVYQFVVKAEPYLFFSMEW